MTAAESLLWKNLRGRGSGWKFRRQVPIGPYVADFVCIESKLIIELDGAPHENAEQRIHDLKRDAWLSERGWNVLRIPNDLVFGGGDMILRMIEESIGNSIKKPGMT